MLDDDEGEDIEGRRSLAPMFIQSGLKYHISLGSRSIISPHNSQRMSTPMEVDPPAAAAASTTKASTSNKDKPRFEVKKVEHLVLIPGEANLLVECCRFVGMGYSYSIGV
jgi:hypothetical protein